jgi:hypothetical protein
MTKKEELRCFEEAVLESDKRHDISFANAPGRNRKLVSDLRITCSYPNGPTSSLLVAAAKCEGREANHAYTRYEFMRNCLARTTMIIESTDRMHPHLIQFIDSVLMK